MIKVLLIIIAFLFMEFIAWFSHKYIMHGFLWYFHRDHHIRQSVAESFFEKNDLFFLLYAIPAIILVITGFSLGYNYLISIGAGITLYGFTYFLIHDVLIHQRIKINIKINNIYFNALIQAHEAHHYGKNITDFKNYGLLVFPKRYFNE